MPRVLLVASIRETGPLDRVLPAYAHRNTMAPAIPIFVVEDEALQVTLQDSLGDGGCSVVQATSARQASEMLDGSRVVTLAFDLQCSDDAASLRRDVAQLLNPLFIRYEWMQRVWSAPKRGSDTKRVVAARSMHAAPRAS